MNFSKHTKLSKLLSLLLVICMVSTLFAGCKKEKPADDTVPGMSLDMSDETEPSETEASPTETTEPVIINEKLATITAQMNIRSAPNTDSAITGTLYAGDKVEIQTQREVFGKKWGYISEDDGALTGWIQMEFVVMDFQPEEPITPETTAPESTDPTEPESTGTATNIKGVITANGLNIRSEASTDGKVQGSYNKGDVVTILETKDGWGRTIKGWIKMEFVNTSGNTTGNTGSTTNNQGTGNNNVSGNGSEKVIAKGIIIAEELNVRASANKDGDKVGSYTYGNRVEIYEKSNGWGRTNKGWISMSYVYEDGTTGTKTAKGVIAAEGGLNIRSGPSTDYASVGAYATGDSVTILEQFTFDGTTWGCTNKGWISMKYVNTGDSTNTNNNTNTGTNNTTNNNLSGVITATELRIRSGPGTGYDVVGSYNYGDAVVILERQTANDIEWGKTNLGWISMNYVKLT